MSEISYHQVLDFWFEDCQSDPDKCNQMGSLWYGGGPEFDQQVASRFGDLYEKACFDALSSWGETAEGALALVIVLDQFSRQLHRSTPRAFSQDPMARAIAIRTVEHEMDKELSIPGRLFLYHPFQHSEFLDDQEYGVSITKRLLTECSDLWRDYVQGSLKYFEQHRDIIREFGRFPHRNQILGRESTPEELVFLESASRFGQ